MAIDGGARKSLKAGTRLIGTHRKVRHAAEVVTGEDGKLRFRLEDGREFGSPSAAGSAVMGGIACNGWRFWSLVDEESTEPQGPRKVKRSGRPKVQPADAGDSVETRE